MKYIKFLCALITSLVVSSCSMIAPNDNVPPTYALLPGECLQSDTLEYFVDEDVDLVRSNCYILVLKLDLVECQWKKVPNSVISGAKCLMPPTDMFTQFGKNKSTVKKMYEQAYDDFTESYTVRGSNYDIITVLYDDGLSLTADKTFAGVPAGENLASIIDGSKLFYDHVSSITNRADEQGALLGIPLEYRALLESGGIAIIFPLGDRELVKESITFKLEVPVKKVKFLSWINAQIDDPDAPVPYEDMTLHCEFVAEYTLL